MKAAESVQAEQAAELTDAQSHEVLHCLVLLLRLRVQSGQASEEEIKTARDRIYERFGA
jgi:hypothetical protein